MWGRMVVGDWVTNTFADNPQEEKELEAWGEYLALGKSSVNGTKPTDGWHALCFSRDLSLQKLIQEEIYFAHRNRAHVRFTPLVPFIYVRDRLLCSDTNGILTGPILPFYSAWAQ